jgi:hypothetical protein
MSEDKVCGRAGCGKRLRSNNTKGVCSSGCLATGEPGERERSKASKGVLKRFRIVAGALGKDPNALIEEFAGEWLKTLLGRLE